jgi:hypothetical protein
MDEDFSYGIPEGLELTPEEESMAYGPIEYIFGDKLNIPIAPSAPPPPPPAAPSMFEKAMSFAKTPVMQGGKVQYWHVAGAAALLTVGAGFFWHRKR